mmetsp:Transcript_18386/g.46133  ORF Transcript_18386/g.46133 Transcript_18386/m.46133 type:complete len:117 (+) Transcript_18386:770-1120(+)
MLDIVLLRKRPEGRRALIAAIENLRGGSRSSYVFFRMMLTSIGGYFCNIFKFVAKSLERISFRTFLFATYKCLHFLQVKNLNNRITNKKQCKGNDYLFVCIRPLHDHGSAKVFYKF